MLLKGIPFFVAFFHSPDLRFRVFVSGSRAYPFIPCIR